MNYHVVMYAVMNGVGLLAAFLVSKILYSPSRIDSRSQRAVSKGMFATVLIGAILGAKIPVWVSYGIVPQNYWDGKSLFGGLIGGFLAMNLYKFVFRISTGGFGDRFVIPLCVAAGFGKIGCFFHGCCGGREFCGIVQPTQLYESAFQFLFAAFFIGCYRFHKAGGVWFPVYMVLYMSMRFGMEFLRNEPPVLFSLTVYQILALFFLPVFGIIIFRRIFRKNVEQARPLTGIHDVP